MPGDYLRAGAFPGVSARPQIPVSHRPSRARLVVSKEPKAEAPISGWLATLMEYPIVIKYVLGAENSIADALFVLDSIAVDNEMLNKLTRGVPSFACPVA